MTKRAFMLTLLAVIAAAAETAWADEQSSGAAEMARKLQDPLANIAALMTENQVLFGTGDDKNSYSFQLQPVYALDFPEAGFSFLPRAIIPIIGAAPRSDLPLLGEPVPSGGSTAWGLGDVMTQFFFAPKTKSSWKLGLGPQFSWKTRTDEKVGGPGWGAGAGLVVVGNITEQLSCAPLITQLWSYDGDFSTMAFQPNLYYNLEFLPGAYVAYNGSISADWKASSGNTFTLPLGATVGRTFDMGKGYGLDVGAGPFWNAVRPDGAAEWLLKFGITMLFPS